MALYRGNDFRRTFSEIGNVRILIPKSVKVMAPTATATKETLDSAIQHLSMENPSIVGLPPNRPNIKYIVERNTGIHTFCYHN